MVINMQSSAVCCLCMYRLKHTEAQGQMHGHTSHFTPPVFSAALADLRWMIYFLCD